MPRGGPTKDPARLAPGVEDQIIGPRPLAYAIDVSERHCRQLAKDGIVIRQGTGSYWLIRSIRNYVRFQRSGAEADEISPAVSNFNDAKTRKMIADAEKAELELLEFAGELVRTKDVSRIWEAMLGRIRAKILSLPSKVAPGVQDETEIPVIEQRIRVSVEEVLSELSRLELSDEDLGDIPDADAQTAAKVNGRAVGGKRAPAKQRKQRRARKVEQ